MKYILIDTRNESGYDDKQPVFMFKGQKELEQELRYILNDYKSDLATLVDLAYNIGWFVSMMPTDICHGR